MIDASNLLDVYVQLALYYPSRALREKKTINSSRHVAKEAQCARPRCAKAPSRRPGHGGCPSLANVASRAGERSAGEVCRRTCPNRIVIKQSNAAQKSKNQIPLWIPLSHPTPKLNQNNQNPGKIPGNLEHWRHRRPSAPRPSTRADRGVRVDWHSVTVEPRSGIRCVIPPPKPGKQ